MKDMFGSDISKNDLVVYANDSGFLTIALVLSTENKLTVVKRGFRNKEIVKELRFPNNVIKINDFMSSNNSEETAKEIEFLMSKVNVESK